GPRARAGAGAAAPAGRATPGQPAPGRWRDPARLIRRGRTAVGGNPPALVVHVFDAMRRAVDTGCRDLTDSVAPLSYGRVMSSTEAVASPVTATIGSLSPSRASDFMTCPLLYRFRVID